MADFRKCTGICVTLLVLLDIIPYGQSCDSMDRVLAKVDTNVTFTFQLKDNWGGLFIHQAEFRHGYKDVLNVIFMNGDALDISYSSRIYKNRTQVFGYSDGRRRGNLTIILQDIQETDNGNYTLLVHLGPMTFCRTLFVVESPTVPQVTIHPKSDTAGWVEEGSPISFTGVSSRSTTLPAGLSITMAWLVGGVQVSSDVWPYMVDNNTLRVLYTSRTMDGTIVTYRATEESGSTSDWNYTLRISYGPGDRVTFTPDRTFYLFHLGDVIPDITCSAICNPLCHVLWKAPNGIVVANGSRLHLGKAASSTSGGYTCHAIRNGWTKVAKRQIYIHLVQDTSSTQLQSATTTTEITLSALLALTFIGLVLLAVYVFRISTRCPGRKVAKSDDGNGTSADTGHSNTIAMENYTDLRSERQVNTYDRCRVEIAGERENPEEVFYENPDSTYTNE